MSVGVWEFSEPPSQAFGKSKIVLKIKFIFKKFTLFFCDIIRLIKGEIYRRVWDKMNWYHTNKFQKNVFPVALYWFSAKVAVRKGSELEWSLLHIWQKFPLLTAEKTWHGTLEQNWNRKIQTLSTLFFCLRLTSPGNKWLDFSL